MERRILLVDDQRDILKLLRSALDTLKNDKIKISEAPSGEEALLESSRHNVDLLVTDYKLPGMSGVELMRKIRVRHPEVKVILVTGTSDKKARDEMLNAGALAIFDKPIPMADFLDSVERGLGLVQTIFPPEKATEQIEEKRYTRVSDLIANFRQDAEAEAVFLLNDRGLVQARTGALHDSSMEVSLISALMAVHNASLKVARYNHQENLDAYHVFSNGDHDLFFIPVTPMYALLVAGNGLANEDKVLETISGLLALRTELERALKSMGVTGELKEVAASAVVQTVPLKQTDKLARAVPAPEMEQLLQQAPTQKTKAQSVDDFWNDAAEKNAKKSANPDVMSLEEAKKLGILSDGK
ncbi:MAG: response regulator [Anaerolineales bacterium]|nr:response regulator [Anaerolineales bacterium]MBX3036166.1 response regulator [Anaerolineales bacterium]